MIRLERFTEQDWGKLISWVKTEELMLQFGGSLFTFPLTEEQLKAYTEEKNRLVYKVIAAGTGEHIGHAEIGNIIERNKSATISRILIGDYNYRGKGIGKMLVSLLLDVCYKELQLHRVDLWVHNFNKQAIECYKSAGFVTEGLARESTKVKDKYWSAYHMSILRPEWEAANRSQ